MPVLKTVAWMLSPAGVRFPRPLPKFIWEDLKVQQVIVVLLRSKGVVSPLLVIDLAKKISLKEIANSVGANCVVNGKFGFVIPSVMLTICMRSILTTGNLRSII